MNSRFIKIVGLLCFSYSAQAQQRLCDLEAVCISPADTVMNGKNLPLRFGWQNLGPDTMFRGDTAYYQLTRIVDGKKSIDYTGSFGASGERAPVNIGGRSIYMDKYFITFNYPDLTEPLVIDYCVRIGSRTVNAYGDTIQFTYRDTNATNNSCCKQVVVMPVPQTNAIGEILDNLSESFTVYPNPATHTIYLQVAERLVAHDVHLSILDLMGRSRLVKYGSELHWRSGISAIDVGQLPTGVYQLNLATPRGLMTKRFSVYK